MGRFHEPTALVDAARDCHEDIGGTFFANVGRLVDGCVSTLSTVHPAWLMEGCRRSIGAMVEEVAFTDRERMGRPIGVLGQDLGQFHTEAGVEATFCQETDS